MASDAVEVAGLDPPRTAGETREGGVEEGFSGTVRGDERQDPSLELPWKVVVHNLFLFFQ